MLELGLRKKAIHCENTYSIVALFLLNCHLEGSLTKWAVVS